MRAETILKKSSAFLAWEREYMVAGDIRAPKERHYTPQELADLWHVSVQTIRDVFRDEEGVLKLGTNGTRNKRGYKTLRIPESVVERVHTRLSA